MNIIVCGLPGSGNHLIINHLKRSGVHAVLDHANNEQRWKSIITDADLLIIPFRLLEDDRRASAARRGGPFSNSFEKQKEIRERIAKSNKPIYMICFEEILRTKGKAINDLFNIIGINFSPWPSKIDNDKPETGRVMSELERRKFRKT